METVLHFTSLLYEENCVEDSLENDRPSSPSVGGFSTKKFSVMPAKAKGSDVSPLDPHTDKNADDPRRRVDSINEVEKRRVINKAKRCLEWAQDADRPPVPGAEKMTDDQVGPRVVALIPLQGIHARHTHRLHIVFQHVSCFGKT